VVTNCAKATFVVDSTSNVDEIADGTKDESVDEHACCTINRGEKAKLSGLRTSISLNDRATFPAEGGVQVSHREPS